MPGSRAGGATIDCPYSGGVTRRWLIVCVLVFASGLGGILLTSLLTQRPPLQSVAQPGPTVVVRVPEITWNNTTATSHPTLYSLARKGAVGGLLTRNLSGHSCTPDSWLSLSGGTRTAVGPVVDETLPGEPVGICPDVTKPVRLTAGTAFYPEWLNWRKTALSRTPKADIGRLASTAREAGQCVMAVGSGAALGAADRTGFIENYVPGVAQADFTTCPMTLVSLTTPADSALAQVVAKLPADTTLIVASLADDSTTEHLRAVVITGPQVAHGRLTSLNIRQIGMIGTVDLTALLLQRYGSAAPTLPEARAPAVEPSASPYGPVTLARDLGTTLSVEHSVIRSFFPRSLIVGAIVVALGVLLWRWRLQRAYDQGRQPSEHPVLRFGIAVTAGALSALPAATFTVGIVPWYRFAHPGIALTAGVLLIAIGVALAALTGPWRRHPAGSLLVILAVTWYVVLNDAMHGSRLQLTSMMGLQPLYGGRFYGMGNVGYAMLATSGLLIAALLADSLIRAGRRDLAAITVVLVAVPTVLVDGYPAWGADGGGPTAMIPAFAYLALNAAGLRVTWKRVAVIGAITALVVGTLSLIDYLAPLQYRTHLGGFVSGLRNGGDTGGLSRISSLNTSMVTSGPLTLMVPVLLLVAIVVLIAPQRRFSLPVSRLWTQTPFLGNGLVAAVICWVIGFFVNDSGTAIPPVGMLVSVPLLVMLAVGPSRPTAPVRDSATRRQELPG